MINRNDQTINICEIKFSEQPFVIDKKYAQVLQNKRMAFKQQTATKKNTLITMISTYGVADNSYKQQLVDNEISMDNLFDE